MPILGRLAGSPVRRSAAGLWLVFFLTGPVVGDDGAERELAAAEAALAKGRFDEALTAALALAERPQLAARARFLAGRVEAARHRPEAAVTHLLAARARVDPGDVELEHGILEALGLQALTAGRPGLAVASLEAAFERVERHRDGALERVEGRAHGLLGLALQKVGQYERALSHYRSAADVYRQREIPAGEIAAWLNAGTVEGEWLGRFDDAVASFERALAIGARQERVAEELIGVLRLNIAEAHSDAGRLAEAAAPLAAAGDVFERMAHLPLQARTAITASKVRLLEGNVAAAEAAARRALELGRQVGDPDLERLGQLRLGRALLAGGATEPAREAFAAAIDALETLRDRIGVEELQISFLRDKRETYERWFETGPAPEQAFVQSERFRRRSFVDHLPGARSEGRPPSPATVTAALPAGGILLEYFFGDRNVYGMAIDAGGTRFADLGAADGLDDRIAFFVDALSRGEIPDPTTLRERLVDPLIPGGAVPATWVVVPDGALSRLPFALLLRSRREWRRAPVSYVPAAAVLERTGGPTREAPSLLAIGVTAPRPAGESLPPLARAAAEARAAARYFERARVLADGPDGPDEPTVREALASGHDVLHVATHTRIDGVDPDGDGLGLASSGAPHRGEDDDGLLSVRELAQLRLPFRLAVLSGCTTRGSDPAPGYGVLGLGRAFLQAGTSSVLVTLWEVSDETAMRVTGSFYRRLAEGKRLDAALAATVEAHGDRADAWAFALVGVGAEPLPGLRAPAPSTRALLGMIALAAGAALMVLAVWRRRREKKEAGAGRGSLHRPRL